MPCPAETIATLALRDLAAAAEPWAAPDGKGRLPDHLKWGGGRHRSLKRRAWAADVVSLAAVPGTRFCFQRPKVTRRRATPGSRRRDSPAVGNRIRRAARVRTPLMGRMLLAPPLADELA